MSYLKCSPLLPISSTSFLRLERVEPKFQRALSCPGRRLQVRGLPGRATGALRDAIPRGGHGRESAPHAALRLRIGGRRK